MNVRLIAGVRSMFWDYGEVNPLSEARGSWDLQDISEVLSHLTPNPSLLPNPQSPLSATALPPPSPNGRARECDGIVLDPEQ
jgi:adenine-specific DNA methylase